MSEVRFMTICGFSISTFTPSSLRKSGKPVIDVCPRLSSVMVGENRPVTVVSRISFIKLMPHATLQLVGSTPLAKFTSSLIIIPMVTFPCISTLPFRTVRLPVASAALPKSRLFIDTTTLCLPDVLRSANTILLSTLVYLAEDSFTTKSIYEGNSMVTSVILSSSLLILSSNDISIAISELMSALLSSTTSEGNAPLYTNEPTVISPLKCSAALLALLAAP